MKTLNRQSNECYPSTSQGVRKISRCLELISELGALAFMFYLWMFSQSVLASEAVQTSIYSSLWLRAVDSLATEAGQGSEGPITFSGLQLSTKVDIDVSGPISRVRVKQVFDNPSQLWVEGEYTYPLPESAVVDRFRMLVGERVIEGEIQEKKQAAKTFAKARQQGKRASLISHHRSNQFRTQVTNIGPEERIEIEFEYQQWLDYKEGRFDLRFPMVSTPAYTPTPAEGSVAVLQKDFVAPANHYRSIGEKMGNPVTLSVRLDAGIPTTAPTSSSHKVSVQQLGSSRFDVELKETSHDANKDFLLSWQPLPASQPKVTILKQEHDEGHYGLLMVMPPQENFEVDQHVSRELVLVLDVSGSMQGPSIEQAKSALLKALEQLEPEDFFNLIWFSNRTSSLFTMSQQATARNLSLARHKVQQLSADGGTNMLPALERALQRGLGEMISSEESPLEDGTQEVLRQIVFITDGAVSNEAELFSMIRQQLGESRLFTVGIGSAPNSYFMRKAARAGRGSFTYVNSTEVVEEKVGELFDQIKAPALTNVDIDFHGYQVEIYPQPLPDVYLGEPLYAVFQSPRAPEFATLSGTIDGQDVYMQLDLQETSGTDKKPEALQKKGIAAEWARRKIEHLFERQRDMDAGEQSDLTKEILEIALTHRLVSKYTSLVAVDYTPERVSADLKREKIPSNLPAGWRLNRQSGQSLRLAQTSSGIWFQFYSGLAALLLAYVLVRLTFNKKKEFI